MGPRISHLRCAEWTVFSTCSWESVYAKGWLQFHVNCDCEHGQCPNPHVVQGSTVPRINLTKKVYTENYETLLRKTNEDLNKWKDIFVHRLEKLIMLTHLLHNVIYIFNAVFFTMRMAFLAEMEKLILKFTLEVLENTITKNSIEKEQEIWRNSFLDFKIYPCGK